MEIALSLRLECAKHGVRDHPEPGEDYSSSCSHARNKKKANQCSDHVEGRQGSLRQGLNESSFQLSLGTSVSLVLSAPTIKKIAKQRLLNYISQKSDPYSIIINPLAVS